MKKILFAVILSVLTLCIYSQDKLVYKVEKYKGEQRVQCERPKNKFIQIEEKRGYVIVDDSTIFYLIERLPDSSDYCKSSYWAVSNNVYYYLYIFDSQILIERANENCDEFIVYYFHKFKPNLVY